MQLIKIASNESGIKFRGNDKYFQVKIAALHLV